MRRKNEVGAETLSLIYFLLNTLFKLEISVNYGPVRYVLNGIKHAMPTVRMFFLQCTKTTCRINSQPPAETVKQPINKQAGWIKVNDVIRS